VGGKLRVLMITAFVDMLGTVIIFPLLPLYATKLGANATTVGFLIASFAFAQLISAPVWGRFSDRYGRRPALLGGLIISATAYVVFAFAGTLWLLLVSRIVQGIGGGTIGVIQAYVADVSDPKDRAKGLGWLSAATSLGAVVGPAIGSIFIHFFGRHAPGLAAAVLCLGVSVFAWKYLDESHEVRTAERRIRPRSPRAAIIDVLTHPKRPAPRLVWIYAIAIGAFYGTGATFPLVLADRLHVTESTVGFFVMYFGGMGVVVRIWILGRMIEWLGEPKLARLGLILLAVGLTLVQWINSYPMMFLSFTLMPVGTAFVFPSITAMLSRVVSQRERGLYMGVQHTFGGVSRVSFPLAAGYMMDRFGVGSPFILAGALVALTLFLTLEMESFTNQESPPQGEPAIAETPSPAASAT
jgi:multidrug resistance protein